jgi:two-component system, chemotaxis family, chemotaxis protein CheY
MVLSKEMRIVQAHYRFSPMKHKILAIDDSKAMRFLLQTVLSKDHQVITAPDGCSAMLWLSKKNFPDLIILDSSLPDMNDWEMIEQFSSSGIYQDIPLIVLSSSDNSTLRQKCQQYGVAEYFSKPFNPMELAEAVNRVLKGQRKAIVPAIAANAN